MAARRTFQANSNSNTWYIILSSLFVLFCFIYLNTCNKCVHTPQNTHTSDLLSSNAKFQSDYDSTDTIDKRNAQAMQQTRIQHLNEDLGASSRLLGVPTRHSPNLDADHTKKGLPINIRTSGSYDTEYTQLGFLSNGKENLIPLFGRMIMPNRNKWQYYTMSDKFHSIRLPITANGKNASGEYGCDEISNGDTVYVEGYNRPFKVTLYEKQQFNYIPYL
tara:strand:+ start:1846 stop:2502 length:657 start_codon:yes stop_codon:yes gene_type:complete